MNYTEANSEKNELGRREIQKKKKKRWGKRSQERKGCEEAKRKASQERTWEQEKRKRADEEGRSAQSKGAELLHAVIRIPVHPGQGFRLLSPLLAPPEKLIS